MIHLLFVALGGAVGASLRHLTGTAALRLLGPNYPWGTIVANIVGCFFMGLFVEALVRKAGVPAEVRLFLATGLLGGYTTFSTFSLDAFTLYERGQLALAAAYVLGSVAAGILALFVGLAVGRVAA